MKAATAFGFTSDELHPHAGDLPLLSGDEHYQMTVTGSSSAVTQPHTGSHTQTQPENSGGQDYILLFNSEDQPALGSISDTDHDPSW